ncbi:hypothetical protein MLD38_010930 [Melastoma candidum]|uniref:Uncharacterized protein n=1 Tax=Melastoma candidum TaxID=119954 RepID=A0ACB9R381_9MYRT|nr:hypothetical protein MLD38_010930 [Melastoma candidum]
MAGILLKRFRGTASSLLNFSSAVASAARWNVLKSSASKSNFIEPLLPAPSPCSFCRYITHGSVGLVLSDGKAKFEIREVDPPKKEKWKNKKRFLVQKKREKEKRKAANRKDPRHLGKKRKPRFANAEERIKYKLEKARIKEALLIEKLKRYEVPQAHGPEVQPHKLNGEERFYLKKMAQKKSNYVPIGRRGVFGGVILNMHLHWKKHETVKVICKPCKAGQIQEYANELARLSGGIPIQVIGDNTIIFYRGKDYVQPEVMLPIDTLSKKKALQKSKYEQSLESVRRFIAIGEKELELYYRHIALYGDPNCRNPMSILEGPGNNTYPSGKLAIQDKRTTRTSKDEDEDEEDDIGILSEDSYSDSFSSLSDISADEDEDEN